MREPRLPSAHRKWWLTEGHWKHYLLPCSDLTKRTLSFIQRCRYSPTEIIIICQWKNNLFKSKDAKSIWYYLLLISSLMISSRSVEPGICLNTFYVWDWLSLPGGTRWFAAESPVQPTLEMENVYLDHEVTSGHQAGPGSLQTWVISIHNSNARLVVTRTVGHTPHYLILISIKQRVCRATSSILGSDQCSAIERIFDQTFLTAH